MKHDTSDHDDLSRQARGAEELSAAETRERFADLLERTDEDLASIAGKVERGLFTLAFSRVYELRQRLRVARRELRP